MMPRIPLLLVLVLLLAFLLTCTVESAVITHYTVEMVTTSNSSGSSWATYDETVCSSGSTIKVSGSGYAFNALKFSSDFYQLPLTPWFASQFGFLSPMASGLCTGFCEDKTLSTFNGFYSFSSNPNDLRDGGGDWPMIGLFVYNMMLPTSGKVCSLASSADSVTVEYSGLVAVGASASAKPLKAQVTLSQSGTIVFRYQSLPKLASAKDQIPPSVGLILTKNQRVVVEAPTESNGIVAYRFTPQLDTCPATKEQGSCLSSADCGWCSATSSCISIITQQDRCPRTQFVTSTPETPTPGYQKFYNVKMDYSGRLVETQNQWLTIQSLANVNEVEFLLLQPFPYFMGANSVGSNLNIYGTNPSVLALNSASFNCNPIKNVCPNGNYSMSLLMGQSSMTWARAHAIQYTYQFSNGVTCESASQGDDCLDFVMQVLGVVPINFITILAPPQVFAYQVALNPDGSVDMVFEVSAPTQPLVWTYPPLMMGLMRNGISDPSSVVIPPAMIQNGLHLRFTPVSACPNCGAHGYCDNATGTCECAIGFNGPTCDLCAPGFYGRNCLPCPSCVNGGTCDAGMGGSGTCTCPVGFTGPTCLQKCTKVHGDGTCSKCKSPGGRCLCGLCVCNDGYTGSSCSKVSYDPCMRYTFDGCPICGSHPGCAFCFSNVCYSPSLSGTSRGYSCSYSATKEESNICVITPMPATSQSEAVSIFIVVLLSSASFVCFSLVVLIAVLTYRRRVVLNRMVEYAGTATLDDAVFKKRRTVVQHFVVPPAVILPDQFVMAVPLKQISLRKLAVLQLEEEKHVSGNQERSVHDHT